MCRHLAYLGPARSLAALVVDPPHSLYEQSWAPRRQQHGSVNADGFGAGWYVEGRPTPVRYRRAQPIWTDASFASLAPTITSSCVLAAVRSATPGFGNDETSAAPFTHDRWLFSHNGRVEHWPHARKTLWPQLAEVPDALAPVDSALLFALALGHLQSGTALGAALAAVTRDVLATGGGRLTMLATDGEAVAGSVLGEPLYVRADGGHDGLAEDGVVVASEPDDASDGWQEVPDGSLVQAARGRFTITAMDIAESGALT